MIKSGVFCYCASTKDMSVRVQKCAQNGKLIFSKILLDSFFKSAPNDANHLIRIDFLNFSSITLSFDSVLIHEGTSDFILECLDKKFT